MDEHKQSQSIAPSPYCLKLNFNVEFSRYIINMKKTKDDLFWMNKALMLAQKAYDKNEVPVGCLIVEDNKILSSAFNLKENLQTPLGHAEVMAIHKAAKKKGSWRLENCTLYVTLEPCPMCAGVILQSRIKKIVFAAADPKSGAVKSLYTLLCDSRLNHQVEVASGVLEQEASEILKSFFKDLRKTKKLSKK